MVYKLREYETMTFSMISIVVSRVKISLFYNVIWTNSNSKSTSLSIFHLDAEKAYEP
jgi:hypothetical protein